MTMFSFGTLPNLGEGLFTSGTLAGGVTLPTSFIVAPVNTIIEKTTCAFCENLLQPSHGMPKMGDHKQLEDLALDHFTRKILGAEEESLGDVSEVFPDDLDGTRYRRLLTSVKLCEGCIFHFAKCEETVLKDQMAYIGKMSGMRDYCEVLQDPWLDLKRLAYTKLKGREGTIKEKLQLMSRMFPSNQNTLKIIFTPTPSTSSSAMSRAGPSGNGPSTSTPVSTPATTTAKQLLVTSIGSSHVVSNCPTTGVVSMDISDVMNQEQEQQQAATCQFAVASDKSSISSSSPASPNHGDDGKEMDNSQDSNQTRMDQDQDVDDSVNVQPDRNEGKRQEEESKTEDRERAVVDVEDQESSNMVDNQETRKNRKDSDAENEEGTTLVIDTTDQQENQSQDQDSQEVNEPAKNKKKRAADDSTKKGKPPAPVSTQEMLDVLEESDKDEEAEEEEEDDADNDDGEADGKTESGRATPDTQCQKVVVCLDKLDPSKTPVKLTPAKSSPAVKTPPKNKPPRDTPSKIKTPVVVPSKSKTPSVTPTKSKTSSENKPSKNRTISETSSSCSSTKSSRKSSTAMPLSKKTASTKDSTPVKTSSKNTSSSVRTSMNPPAAKTSSNSKPLRRGSVTPSPSDDEGPSTSKKGKKRPLSVVDASEKIFGTKKLKEMVRSSPREYFTPPESKKEKKKKIFKIGNRYLTESSSSDDDSEKDSDVHFTDCTANEADSDF